MQTQTIFLNKLMNAESMNTDENEILNITLKKILNQLLKSQFTVKVFTVTVTVTVTVASKREIAVVFCFPTIL